MHGTGRQAIAIPPRTAAGKGNYSSLFSLPDRRRNVCPRQPSISISLWLQLTPLINLMLFGGDLRESLQYMAVEIDRNKCVTCPAEKLPIQT